jgi:hypothetical protein
LKLILHVGLPKTATTTIQHVMETTKPMLAERGVLYPLSTMAQLELVRRTQFKQRDGETGPGSLAEAMGWVAEEARALRPERIILSCERLVLVKPVSVARMQQAIATWWPEVDEVRVLAYVRDPISWATSLCQQRLKMGTTRLAEFVAKPWPLGLEEMLSKYVHHYGLDAVRLRYLHPDHLVNGNLVDDFMAAIGLPGFVVPGPAPVLNQSLTQHGAQVADVLAGQMPRGSRKGPRRRLLGQLLQEIEGPRFVLPREAQERIISASLSDVDYVRRQWGLDLRPVLVEPQDEPDLERDAVLGLALDLVHEVERVVIEEEGPDKDDGS